MVDMETARQMALALPGAIEQDHFGIPSFRINKKIFSTLWTHANKMMVKLPSIQQSIFHSFDPNVFYPVPNKWGEGGATLVELETVPPQMLQDALNVAYEAAMKKKK
jgi:hypothetical protein